MILMDTLLVRVINFYIFQNNFKLPGKAHLKKKKLTKGKIFPTTEFPVTSAVLGTP